MTSPMTEDERWMRRAIELASRGKGRVEPNPPVGAVIVRNGAVGGEGWHEKFGGPHAEIRAMESAKGDCSGATLYVTLEPCTGTNKKTPPCCDAVIAARFSRIVIGSRDATREPSIPAIQAAEIEVTTGVLEDECQRLVAPFLKLTQQGMPWVIAKWAMTADGRTATVTGESKWISSTESRELVHRWRDEVDAVLVGAGTVRRDDPLLTCRIPNGRNPERIVVDSRASLSAESALVRSVGEAPLILACTESASEERCQALAGLGVRILRGPERNGRVDLEAVLRFLGEEQMTNLMVEGGSQIMGELFDRGMVDEVRIFVAPKLLGGNSALPPIGGAGIRTPSEAVTLANVRWCQVGDDMLLRGDVAQRG